VYNTDPINNPISQLHTEILMSPTFHTRIFLFVALAICYVMWDVQALPSPFSITGKRQYISSSCSDLHHCRTIWNIIWGSVVTLFSCTWVAVHPNIPQLSSKRKFWLHRLSLMMITLTVPELVVTWALRQWFAVFSQARALCRAAKRAFCFLLV